MKKTISVLQALAVFFPLIASIPVFGKTHKDNFNVSCNALWPAVKDTLRNSGKYGIVSINNEELSASYDIGGGLAGQRLNFVVLNPQGNSCQMQVQTVYTGLVHNDAGDFRKRVEESLAKLQVAKTNPSSKPVTASSPATSEDAANKADVAAKP